MIIGLLDQTGGVATPAASDGAYTVTANASLRCRVVHLMTQGAYVSESRAEMSERRILMWDSTYTMPANARVTVAGMTFSVVDATVSYPRGPWGTVEFGRAEIVEATVQDGS